MSHFFLPSPVAAFGAIGLLAFAAGSALALDPDNTSTKVTTEHITVAPTTLEAAQPPEVHYGEDGLPAAVRDKRARLIAAAHSGDITALLPLLATGTTPTVLTNGDPGSPLDVLKSESGDPDGREVLAVLWTVLDSGWVVEDKGKPEERYIWPYFSRMQLSALSPSQEVELLRLVTAGDFEQMKEGNSYNFFRVEINADGTLKAFLNDL